MFEKLLSLLPYNPGLAHQMAFYSRRMREEAAIRRTGLAFIVLAFMIQFFAVLSPPQPTVAASSNDLVNGGISSAADAASHCRQNVRGYGDILRNYGITCDEVAAAPTTYIHATDYNRRLFSMGHLPYGKPGETPVNVKGSTLYFRYLWGWPYGNQSIKVLKIVAHGTTYFLMYDCGNLVSIGLPQPEALCKYDRSILASSPRCVAPCQYDRNIPSNSPQCFKPCQYNNLIPASSSQCFAHCPVPGKSNLPQNSSQCFAPCPYNSKVSAGNSQCAPPCQYNSSVLSTSSKCYQPCQYNSGIPSDNTQCFQPCAYNKAIPSNSPDCFQPCQYNTTISSSDSACKPCEQSQSSEDTIACISVSKTAANITQNIGNADGTTAHAGDVITYTLYAKNNGKATVKQFVFGENLSDVLDYADVTDPHGGTLDSDGNIRWPAVDIAAGATASQQVTVKVKDPIPSTPVSSTDPGHYDLTMTNVYGNTVNIKLPGSPAQTVETTTTALPNTGPGASLLVAGAIVIVAGYFYARSELLAEESRQALHSMAQA